MKCPVCGNELKVKHYDFLEGYGYCDTEKDCSRCGYRYQFAYGWHRILLPLIETEVCWGSCYERDNRLKIAKEIGKAEKKFRKALLRNNKARNFVKHRGL